MKYFSLKTSVALASRDPQTLSTPLSYGYCGCDVEGVWRRSTPRRIVRTVQLVVDVGVLLGVVCLLDG